MIGDICWAVGCEGLGAQLLIKEARDRCSMGEKSAKKQEEGLSGNTPHSLRRDIALSSTQGERASQTLVSPKLGFPAR